MFDSLDENKHPPPKWYGARIIAGAATSIFISFGLCGVGTALRSTSKTDLLGHAGFYLFFVSLFAFLIGALVTVVEAVIAFVRRR